MTSRRNDAIGGLENLIHLLKTRPELPVPQALSAQYSVLSLHYTEAGEWTRRPMAVRVAEAERVAGLLGLELYGTDGHRFARLQLGGGVEYVVSVTADPPGVLDDEPAEVTP